jgi:hypothetical protein
LINRLYTDFSASFATIQWHIYRVIEIHTSTYIYIFLTLFKSKCLYFLILFSFFCQDKLDNGFKVLSNQYYQEKLLNDSFKHDQLKEVDRCDKISIKESNFKVPNTTKVSIQNLNKLESKSTYLTENVPKIAPLITKALPIQLSAENTDVHKVIIF